MSRHNLNELPEETAVDAHFKIRCRSLFVTGLVTEFGEWGGQRAVAKVLGVNQSNVSRVCKLVPKPFPTTLERKRRRDAFENSNPDHVPIIQSYWVRHLNAVAQFVITTYVAKAFANVFLKKPLLYGSFRSASSALW